MKDLFRKGFHPDDFTQMDIRHAMLAANRANFILNEALNQSPLISGKQAKTGNYIVWIAGTFISATYQARLVRVRFIGPELK